MVGSSSRPSARRWLLGSAVLGVLVALMGILWFLQTRELVGPFLVIGYGIWLVAAVWTYQDAVDRREPGLPWALVVFLAHVLGLAVYLVVRALGSPPGLGSDEA